MISTLAYEIYGHIHLSIWYEFYTLHTFIRAYPFIRSCLVFIPPILLHWDKFSTLYTVTIYQFQKNFPPFLEIGTLLLIHSLKNWTPSPLIEHLELRNK